MEGAVSVSELVIVDSEKLLKMIVDDFLERIDRASRMVARARHRGGGGQEESLRRLGSRCSWAERPEAGAIEQAGPSSLTTEEAVGRKISKRTVVQKKSRRRREPEVEHHGQP